MDGMSDVERLVALEEIKLIKARRDRYMDTKQWDALEALHAPDHRTYNDTFPSWTTASEMMAHIRAITSTSQVAHHSHTPEITFQSPTNADGVWALTAVHTWFQGAEEHWLVAFGHYFETYEKRDGCWLFTSRRQEYFLVRMSPGAVYHGRGQSEG